MKWKEQWQELRKDEENDIGATVIQIPLTPTLEDSVRTRYGSAGDGGPRMSLGPETYGDCYLVKNKEYQKKCVHFRWGWNGGMVSETEWIYMY